MKPDSPRAAIVEAWRKMGASWVDTEGMAGTPDGVLGFAGRMWFIEIKAPGKENGVCGCTATDPVACDPHKMNAKVREMIGDLPSQCACKGHDGTGNAERKTWHRQLAFREAWKGPPVVVVTSAEEAIRFIAARH